MKYLTILSGKYPGLNKFELKTLLETYNVKFKILEEKDRIIILETDQDLKRILERSVLIKDIFEFLVKANNLEELKSYSWKDKVECPYYVDSIRIPRRNPNYKNITEKVADIIWDSLKNPTVSSRNPKTKIIVLVYNDEIYIGKKIYQIKRDFEFRKPNLRPFFHPTALKPEDARLLINLAKVKEGDIILDPFCGTGSILIEACLLGIRAWGTDIQEIMVEGSLINLKKYCKRKLYEVRKLDATKISQLNIKFNAIVTDPPYGIGSKVVSKDLLDLYLKFLSEAYKVLKDNGRIVMFIPHWLENKIEFENFKLIYKYKIKVHSGLTRILYVLEKV